MAKEQSPKSTDVQAAEARDEPASVSWRDFTFTVPRSYADWSVDFLESLEEGKAVGIVRGALGPSQWKLFKTTNPTVRDMDELSASIARALGFISAGE